MLGIEAEKRHNTWPIAAHARNEIIRRFTTDLLECV
jgi:hypothetical protein